MKKLSVVVDTNRIIAALIKDSFSRNILYHADLEFFGVSASFPEVEKYKSMILKKAKLTDEEFEVLFDKLNSRIIFLPDDLIMLKVEEAKQIMFHIDPGDVPFIAAALATGTGVWSEDPHFAKQTAVKVWRTKDLAQFL